MLSPRARASPPPDCQIKEVKGVGTFEHPLSFSLVDEKFKIIVQP
jgi:hypothetical protein